MVVTNLLRKFNPKGPNSTKFNIRQQSEFVDVEA